MTKAEQAYAAAERLIAEAKASGADELSFDRVEFRALSTLPPQIAELERLTYLDLSDTPVSDIAPLAGLPTLTTLLLNGTRVSDIASLARLTALTELWLNNTPVSDIAPLARLPALTGLWLNRTPVSDITPLARLTALTRLGLDRTQVIDLAPLSGLTQLRYLYLDEIPGTDLRPLRNLTRLATEPDGAGLTIAGNGATEADPRIADIAKIEDKAERARVLFDYLERWEPPVPPTFPPQSSSGLRYRVSDSGQLEYDPFSTLPSATRQQSQLHAILREDAAELRHKCGSGHNQPFAIYGTKLDRYIAGLADDVVQMEPVLVWKAGNDLRILLREDQKRFSGDMSNTPPLDPDLRATMEGFVAAHNALSALHPDLSLLDASSLDPAERQRRAETQAMIDALLDAFAVQTRLIVSEIVTDLRDLLQRNAATTETALRDLAVGQDSLENLIKAIVAQAIIETRDETFLSKIAGDARGAAVEVVMVGGALAVGQNSAEFAQLVTSLQPQLAAMLSAWHGADYPVAKAIDWVKGRLRRK